MASLSVYTAWFVQASGKWGQSFDADIIQLIYYSVPTAAGSGSELPLKYYAGVTFSRVRFHPGAKCTTAFSVGPTTCGYKVYSRRAFFPGCPGGGSFPSSTVGAGRLLHISVVASFFTRASEGPTVTGGVGGVESFVLPILFVVGSGLCLFLWSRVLVEYPCVCLGGSKFRSPLPSLFEGVLGVILLWLGCCFS